MQSFETEHYIIHCPKDIVEKVKMYVLCVEKAWPILIEFFNFLGNDFRKKYLVFFEEGSKIEGCVIENGCIKCNADTDVNWQIDTNYPSNLWGALVHETIHGFMQPIKKKSCTYFEDELFDLITQGELYKRMGLLSEKTKSETTFEQQLDIEGKAQKRGLYNNCKVNWKEKGFAPFANFFKSLYQKERGEDDNDIEKQFQRLTSS